MFIIILFSIISCVLSQPPSTCPDLKPLDPPFNFTAFIQAGWYEIARYNNYFEINDDCTHLTFDVTDKEVNFHIDNIRKNMPPGHFDGVIDSNNGIVYYHAKVYEGGFIPITIMDVDYDRFAVGYHCRYDEKTKTKQDMAWILSRTKSMDDETKAAVEDMFHENNIIDRSKFVWDNYANEACKE